MKTYVNIKTSYGTETIDEINSEDFGSIKEYRKEKSRLLTEYKMIYNSVWLSHRPCKSWND